MRIFLKSIGCPSLCKAIKPLLNNFPSCFIFGSKPFTTPPPICGFEYCKTVSPLMMWVISESPSTINSALTHCSPSYVFEVELMQCYGTIVPFCTTSVPGEHILPVDRGLPSLRPPRNCISTEIGQSCSLGMLRGSCE